MIFCHPGHQPAVPDCHSNNVTAEIDLEEDGVDVQRKPSSLGSSHCGKLNVYFIPTILLLLLFIQLIMFLPASVRRTFQTASWETKWKAGCFPASTSATTLSQLSCCKCFRWLVFAAQRLGLSLISSHRCRRHQGPLSEGALPCSQGVCQPWLPDSHLHQSQAAGSQVITMNVTF